jgi:hypothetical protein
MLVEPIHDSVPVNKRGGRGHYRRRPLELHADKGSDKRRVCRQLRPPPEPPWVVERTIGWLPVCNASPCATDTPP